MASNWRQLIRDQNRQPRQGQQHQQYQRIKPIAETVYLNRLRSNKPGSEEEDWSIASEVVSSPLKRLLFSANQLLIQLRRFTIRSLKFVSWDVPRWFLFKLPQLEWMKLIAVPLLIAVATSIISSQLQRESNQIAALNRYVDQIETLTFEQKLLTDTPNSGAIVIARGRTVAALRELDVERRQQLLAFLQSSGLSGSVEPKLNRPVIFSNKEPVISFRLANLSEMDLTEVDLRGADLSEANLNRADLSGADLSGANLDRADLSEADLSGANLYGANLSGADLRGADLSEAALNYAALTYVDLSGANLSSASLNNSFFEETNFEGADLTGARADHALFRGVDGLSHEQKLNLADTGAMIED